jgi:predicted Zn-dependent protease
MRSASSASSRAAAALVLALALAGCDKAPAPVAQPQEPGPTQLAELDRGVGLMGRYEFGPAREVFAALASRHPAWTEARLDLAIATMNRQQEGDEAAAAETLKALVRDRPEDLRAAYVLALLTLHGGAAKEAEPLFRRVADADPGDAYARYFLAQSLLAQGRAEEALPLYESAAALDERLRSARYGASQALARMGRQREAAARL